MVIPVTIESVHQVAHYLIRLALVLYLFGSIEMVEHLD